MKVAIVEDEASYAQQLHDFILRFQTEFQKTLDVRCYYDAKDGRLDFDTCIAGFRLYDTHFDNYSQGKSYGQA